MLNWFHRKPQCPVDSSSKNWIETRFAWLTGELGEERLRSGRTVTPTEEFFPSTYHYTEDDIHDMMCRVASYMDVDPELLNLRFYDDYKPQIDGMIHHSTAGLYSRNGNRFEIWLEVNSLENPANIIATLSHEIGHVVLLGQNRIAHDESDHEELTDLLTVFLGMGIFPANSVLHETNWSDGQMSGWSVGKRGYLSMDMYGYAMALYTLARGDIRPPWAEYLRPDVRGALKRGIRYIQSTRDCQFEPAVCNLDG